MSRDIRQDTFDLISAKEECSHPSSTTPFFLNLLYYLRHRSFLNKKIVFGIRSPMLRNMSWAFKLLKLRVASIAEKHYWVYQWRRLFSCNGLFRLVRPDRWCMSLFQTLTAYFGFSDWSLERCFLILIHKGLTRIIHVFSLAILGLHE